MPSGTCCTLARFQCQCFRTGVDPGMVPTLILACMGGLCFRVGQAAAIAGVSADTLRYSERKGLLPDVPRTDSGYRQYSPANIDRIRLVRSALQLGFSVKQIAGFLRARDAGRPPCHEVRRAAVSLADEMDRQIKQMVKSRSAL